MGGGRVPTFDPRVAPSTPLSVGCSGDGLRRDGAAWDDVRDSLATVDGFSRCEGRERLLP
jgi:hypothetical protein